MAITTNYKYNFDKAEDSVFSWTQFDGSSGGSLLHKASKRSLYQMQWIDPKTGYATEQVTGDVREAAIAFWEELAELQKQKPYPVQVAEPEPKHGVNGYCRKCHSYCYTDCES